jgi:hypothetical protein
MIEFMVSSFGRIHALWISGLFFFRQTVFIFSLPCVGVRQSTSSAKTPTIKSREECSGMDDVTMLAWIDHAKTVSALLVALGVAGEFVGGWIESPIRKRLDSAREAEIARFNKESGDALAAAAAANERAAGLEAKAAQLQLELEKERTARLPRSISIPNQATVIACLKAGPKGPITVVPKTFDEEAEAYAAQIEQVLRQAQFEIRPLVGPRPFGFGVAGAFMLVRDAANPPVHAAHIQSCFRQVGIELAGHGNPKDVPDPAVVFIAVSSKP